MPKGTVKTVRAPKADGSDLHLVRVDWADKVKSTYDLTTLGQPVDGPAVDWWSPLPAVCRENLRHGIEQKLADVHAGVFKDSGSVAACRELTDRKWEALVTGKSLRASSSMFEFLDTLPAEVIAAMAKSLEVEATAQAVADVLSDEQAKEIRKNPLFVKWDAERRIARAEAAEKTAADLGTMFAPKA